MAWIAALVALLIIAWFVVGPGSKPRARGTSDGGSQLIARIRGNGKYSVEVVGESYRAESFRKAFGRERANDNEDEIDVEALLRLENSNPHDPMAVSVWARGAQLGFLSREMARDFRQAMARAGLAKHSEFQVAARVYMGGDAEMYSVSLDLPED